MNIFQRAPTTISVGPNRPTAPAQRMGIQYGNSVQAATYHQHAYNPHPYVHPYLNNANQHPNTYPQQTPAMIANNMYYAEETRAPTKISVDPNGPRAPTTVSVPPRTGGVQHGDGINIDMDTDEESDSGDEDEEDKDPDVNNILVDISTTFSYLKHLRKQYRHLLPQIKKFKEEEMEGFLDCYSLLKTHIIEQQDELEGTVFEKQYGKGLNGVELEDETDEETVDEDDEADTEYADTDDGDDSEDEIVES